MLFFEFKNENETKYIVFLRDKKTRNVRSQKKLNVDIPSLLSGRAGCWWCAAGSPHQSARTQTQRRPVQYIICNIRRCIDTEKIRIFILQTDVQFENSVYSQQFNFILQTKISN